MSIKAAAPFVKWVGGKRQLLGKIQKFYPENYLNYHEPFVGGGAVFFDLSATHGSFGVRATISDSNTELISCYKTIRDQVEDLIKHLKRHKYEEGYYYRQRDKDPTKLNQLELASRMIYLNRTCFNGLYRVNSKGKFNVTFGRYVNPIICDDENLRACSMALKGVKIKNESFEGVLERARARDFVYLDPPYIPVSKTANFTSYQKHGFGMNNQEKLADIFDELVLRGAHVVLSNSDVPWIHERYANHRIVKVNARRSINSNPEKRGPVGEVLVIGER